MIAFIIPSSFIRETYERIAGTTNGYVISNGVNKIFSRIPTEKPEELKDKFVILFIGRYSREKSHRILIEAVKRSRYQDKIQLVFAGAGPLKKKLEQMSLALPNPPIMKFFSREELVRVINYSDLYVHPAEIEIEAIACLEAIACGLVPVISDSKRSATKAFALTENNLFSCNDPSSLKTKIEYWLDHPKEKAECSQRYLGYTKRFDYDSCMSQMETMILDAVSLHNKKAEGWK